MERYVSNCYGTHISETLDGSYWKGPGARNGREREIIAEIRGGCEELTDARYIVRRLTPLECSRLQGLPDCEGNGWADIPPCQSATEEDIDWWEPFWNEWCDLNKVPHKSRKFIRNWLETPLSDSSQYRMYGNGIATPQWFYVCEGIAEQYEGTGHTPTMASLFDGTGSFPYIWEAINGKGTAVWGSEVDPTPMRVSMYRIDGRQSG
jgi:DNA (cytosine-5)-methyltransferase 1